ncbi:MAG: rhomboid family intramembrane serine protease [bacterium]|nr:MAG: rhomboid family intramembrane serine protease [bacterium]
MYGEPAAFVTIGIILVAGYCSYLGFKRPGFIDRYLFDPQAIIYRREPHRLITSAFLHADWRHYIFNAFSLYSFGSHIERIFGAPVLLLIFFGSVLGGNLLSLWLHREERYRALGASGGVCGVIFATIFLLPGGGVRLLFFPVGIPAYVYAILFLFISFYGIRTGFGNIGHDAHLGGAIVGLIITTMKYPRIVTASPLLYVVVMASSILFFLYLYRTQRPVGRRRVRESRGLFGKVSEWRQRMEASVRKREEERLNRLLEKVQREGLNSLSESERAFLRYASERRRKKNQRR